MKKSKRVSWKKVSDKFLKSIAKMPREKAILAVKEKTGITLTWSAIMIQLNRRNISYPRPKLISKLSSEEKAAFKKIYASGSFEEVQKSIERGCPNATPSQINLIARNLGILGKRTHLKGAASTIGAEQAEKNKNPVRIISGTELLENLPLEDRKWDDPEVIVIDEKAWNLPGAREGRFSRIDYLSDGFRHGVVRIICGLFAQEGVNFIVLNGGLIDKNAFKAKIKERVAEAKVHFKEQRAEAKATGKRIGTVLEKDLRQRIESNLKDEVAKALAAILPKIKKPNGTTEFIRFYITTSPVYDGPHGDDIVRRLQALRPDDIRYSKPGGVRNVVKGVEKIIWSINPRKHRLPSKYYSAAAEREIEDKEGQMSRDYPDLWAEGCHASAVHKPSGERMVPYITDPGAHRLEEVTTAENQVGACIVSYASKESPQVIRYWNLRDLIAKELTFITGIKEGSQEIHRNIVEALKKEGGSLTAGLACVELGLDDNKVNRERVEKAFQFLLEEKASERKTWPGLHYNAASQSYSFHLDWIQHKLRYVLPKRDELKEDSFLFDGCTHAGYCTSDYEFIVKKFPEIILEHNIKTMVCLGDITAGLHHNFLCTGEVFSGLNNTDQEVFAAELRATVIFRVFKERFEQSVKSKDITKISRDELSQLVSDALLSFIVIPGNHDLWQELDGNTALQIFLMKLSDMLTYHISILLLGKKFPAINVAEIVKKKITAYLDFSAKHEFSSGIKLAMCHPHMGRAGTTSLRAQHGIGMLGCQITGMANFHTAVVVHKWRPDLGQCITVQVGTLALYTPFETRKMKTVDFGPVYLRVLSHKGKILMTESAFYNKPILQKAIPKSTDINELRKKLSLLS